MKILQLMFNLIFKTGPAKGGKLLLLIVLVALFLSSCKLSNKSGLGIVDSLLTSCPSSPNCVSSDASKTEQKVPPLELIIPPEKAWGILIEQVAQLPRTKIVSQDSQYLYVECRSQIFGFVDDLEFHLRPEQKIVAVRSASRTGYYDFGVNQSRIENLRRTLQQRKVVQ